MSLLNKLILTAGCGAFTLTSRPAQAQGHVLPELVGQWEARQISFTVTGALTEEVHNQLDNPQTAGLNQEMQTGDAQLRVEFRADGGYHFTVTRAGQLVQDESGTYSVAKGRLLASSPTGSSFHDQQVSKLSRRTLVLTFPAGDELPGVEEEVEYRRLK